MPPNYVKIIEMEGFIYIWSNFQKVPLIPTPQDFEVGITTYEKTKDRRDLANHQSHN